MFVRFMDISTTKNGILRCIRCESKDEIKQYRHKTPDKQIIKSGRHYTKITTFPGTGGSGDVPVCSHCYRKFTNGKVLLTLLYIFLVISWLVFGFLLIYIIFLVSTYDPYLVEFNPLPTSENYFFLTLSGIIAFILFISLVVVKSSNINPHRVINIRKNMIFIKLIKASGWMFYGYSSIIIKVSRRK